MIHFRTFREKDWKEFTAIVEEAFERENVQKKNFIGLLKDGGFIGAFEKDKLVGYLRLLIMEGYGHLGQIAVEKEERGKGYGNKLMIYAINYFKEKQISSVGLYVETKNNAAISLYKKYGFRKNHETWHYWIEKDGLNKVEISENSFRNTNLRILTSSDYKEVMRTFPNANGNELKTHLGDTRNIGLSGGVSLPLGLFVDDKLQVYGRFNPEFPGCRPFWVTKVSYFDEFVKQMKEYKEKDHLRITFDRNNDLAEFFNQRNYRLHHHLWMMEKQF